MKFVFFVTDEKIERRQHASGWLGPRLLGRARFVPEAGERGSAIQREGSVDLNLGCAGSCSYETDKDTKIMASKRTLSLLILGSPLLLGVNEAAAYQSYVQEITNYCTSRGYDLSQAYASNTCDSACHKNSQGKSAYLAGNYDYFCTIPPAMPVCTDADGDGYYVEGNACGTLADFNDSNSAAYPGALENCSDGIDNDGNGLVDAADPNAVGCSVTTVCTDLDGDGYSIEGGSCGPIDCNDNDSAVSPGAVEACGDGIDNNCNGNIDTADLNAVGCKADCSDLDGDGFSPDGGSCGPMDCNDSDPATNPGALENCSDGIDNNCNGRLDGSDGVCQDPQVNETHWWRPDPNVVNPVPTPPGSATKRVDLQAVADSNAVRLSWSLTGITPRAQEIYRDTDANPKGRGRVGFTRNGNAFVDHNVTPGTTYYYWVKVTESDRTVTNSQAAAVTVPNNTPTPTPNPTPGTQHPFGWNDPRSAHQSQNFAVSSCTSCHSIDTASSNSALSCYRCHGNLWGGSSGSGSGSSTQHPFGWSDPRKAHQDGHFAVSSCTSCHSIDTANRNSALSCYRCHGNEWGGSSGSGDDGDRNDDRKDDRKGDRKKDRHDD